MSTAVNIQNFNLRKKCFWPKIIKKPVWVPSAKIATLAQIIICPIVFASFYAVVYKTLFGGMSWAVFLVFIINLIAIMAFFPILTKVKNLFLANIDMAVIFSTIVAQIIMVGKYSESLALLQIPYLVFASIALMLQFSITYINR